MPATPISRATRFYHVGLTKVIFMANVANKAAPTRTEINAGTDLSGDLADWAGWTITSGQIDTPDLASRYTGRIAGRLEVDDSSITMYASQNGADVRTILPRGTAGFLMIADGGDVPGNRADVFPVVVTSNAKQRSMGDDAGTLQVSFAITAEPAENVTIPA